jgi:hypothetical protein
VKSPVQVGTSEDKLVSTARVLIVGASGGRNAEVDFRGDKRSNATHASTTDPDAWLYHKEPRMEAKLAFLGHALMENRSGLLAEPA